MLSWRMVIDYPLYAITVALIGAAWVYSVVVTIVRPIMFNGWVLGLLIAALKLVTATLIAILALVVWTLWLNEHRQKRRPNCALIATMFALLGWIGLCLINGDRFFGGVITSLHEPTATNVVVRIPASRIIITMVASVPTNSTMQPNPPASATAALSCSP